MDGFKITKKKKRVWPLKDVELLLKVWSRRVSQLRTQKRNTFVVEEMQKELEEYDCAVSVIEIKNKIHNLTNQYVKEKALMKQKGSRTTWRFYYKIDKFLGRFYINVENNINDSYISDNEISKSSHSSSSVLNSENINSYPKDFVICRACVGECTNYKSLFKFGIINGEKTTLANLINFCTDLEIIELESPGLSPFICTDCILELSRLYIFKKRVHKADQILRSQLNRINYMENDEVEQSEDIMDLNVTSIKTESPLNVEENEDDVDKEEYLNYIIQDVILDEDDVSRDQTKDECSKDQFENPLEIKPNTELDKCVVDILVKKDTPEINSFTCQICNKKLRTEGILRIHMRSHSNDIHYKCKICGEGFSTSNSYEKHKSVHFPNICDICGKSFQLKSSLRIHMKVHGDAEHTCPICSKNFKRVGDYKVHMITHASRPKTYSCDICGKSFYTYKSMSDHRNNHGGLRKFKCTKCFQRFGKADQLESHMLIHAKETSFNCHICSQAFKRESSLLIHLRFHGETTS